MHRQRPRRLFPDTAASTPEETRAVKDAASQKEFSYTIDPAA
jgi:hypothetical protein